MIFTYVSAGSKSQHNYMIIYLLRFWLPFMVNGRIFRELAEWYLLKCWHLETSHMFSLQVKLQPAVVSNYVAPQARFPLHLTDGCKYGSTMWRNLGQCFPTFFLSYSPTSSSIRLKWGTMILNHQFVPFIICYHL